MVVGTDVDGTNSTFMMIWDETVAVVGRRWHGLAV